MISKILKFHVHRGRGAIIKNLRDAGITKPEDYITFYGLRTHAILKNDLVHCLLYKVYFAKSFSIL